MKNSYKLIGLYWDRRSTGGMRFAPIPFDSNFIEAGRSNSISTSSVCRRINVTTLLSVGSDHEFDGIVEEVDGAQIVAVLLDYQPASPGDIHQSFFKHRVLQACALLERSLSSSTVVLMSPFEERGKDGR